ncbi:uncharacterized protein A4U43_C05F4140 [Asparagus officinalis]|uniref:GST C-terminal domain-containing protein n=1 Tax=Asparagus officinalis TaxID=4686 RepID=A0A5P1ETF5_ASPOF|nr:uncharacterized protein A4U43_C05F4140 [Asparagus officinalis]
MVTIVTLPHVTAGARAAGCPVRNDAAAVGLYAVSGPAAGSAEAHYGRRAQKPHGLGRISRRGAASGRGLRAAGRAGPAGAAYDKLEEALAKFDGPFFLGEFSLVDIAYAPFVVERFKPLFSEIRNYDFTKGRPKLTKWIEELNKIDAYRATKHDPEEILGGIKKWFGVLLD